MGTPDARTPPRLVCRCTGVSSTRIFAALQAGAARDLEGIGEAAGAGTVCGSCHPEIDEIVAAHAGRPWPEFRVRENRRACHAATLQRLEIVLFQMIAPRLGPATQLELVALEGLTLDLHLHGQDSPALRENIEARLRKLVCAEIAVRFS